MTDMQKTFPIQCVWLRSRLFLNYYLCGGQSATVCTCHGPLPGSFSNLFMSFSSISTVSCIDELGHHDDNARMAITMENTYQMGEITFTCMANMLHPSITSNY